MIIFKIKVQRNVSVSQHKFYGKLSAALSPWRTTMNSIRIGVLFGVMLIIAGCKEPPPPPAMVPSVTVVSAAIGSISPHSTEVGQVIAYDNVRLQARVRGFLVKKDFQEGKVVKKDTLLYMIEQDQYIAFVKSAQADLMMAQANQEADRVNQADQTVE